MASASIPAGAIRRLPWERIVALAAVLSLALWPIEIHTAFGLPAHPLIIHVPVIFVPILGIATLAIAFSSRLLERYGLLVAVFSVVTLAATLLAVGAGEAFREDRERTMPQEAMSSTLHDHADAGLTVRLTMVLLTLVLVAALFSGRLPGPAVIVLRVLAVLLALIAVGFVIRTGHLGAKLAWGHEGPGGPPPGLQGGAGQPGQGAPPGGG